MSHASGTESDPSSHTGEVSGSGLPANRSTGFYILVLAALVTVVEATGLAYTMVTPALTGIASTYEAPQIGWVMTSVTLVGAVSYATFGKVGDIIGKKKVAVGVTLAFTVGSVLAAIAPTLGVLIAGRALQGMGISAIALVYGLVRDLFPQRLVPIAYGFIGAGFGMSPIIGPVIGGYLIDSFTFRAVFWFLAIYGALVAALVQSLVPETSLRTRTPLDWLGIAILGVGAVAFLLGVDRAGSAGWSDPLTLLGIVGGLLTLALWVRYERRPTHPLIDIGLLKQPRVSGTLVTSAVVQFSLAGSNMLLPLFVMAPVESGYGFGASALESAQYIAVGGIAGAVAGPLCGFTARRVGPRVTLTVGVSALLVGSLLLGLVHTTSPAVMAGKFIIGIGIGVCSASLPTMLVASVPARAQGISGGMMNLAGSLGSAFSTQILAVILLVPDHQRIGGEAVYAESGFTFGFLLIAAVGVIGLAAMALAGPRPTTGESEPDPARHTGADGRGVQAGEAVSGRDDAA